MVKLDLQVLIEGENVSNVQPADFNDHQFWLQIKCTMCHEVHPKTIAIIPSSRRKKINYRTPRRVIRRTWFSSAHFAGVADVEFQKSAHAKVENKGASAVNVEDIENHSYKSWLVLECRNLEPIGFEARDDNYICTSSLSDTKFEDVTLDGEWSDYDEKVSVTAWQGLADIFLVR
ncbi:hypothetical protein E3Q23_02299 [Wallemia mellicola]|uniref:DUF866-domain-containing protein n=1 Tax=Wallemia mellicola TaxID=1708541 RepID=A0A4T0TIQ6_9BASI|nr:hypothetical protein E3Q23_02299 [Wallemia mellicola]TIB98515.1 DUF866-domain-containing protein [Wallemia mellicola]TIC10196.1 DUF866-domain-containing protein [Wallemia mellicola]TIC64717.1 DUF866-domain-containing protein [Wallemia mellicola]